MNRNFTIFATKCTLLALFMLGYLQISDAQVGNYLNFDGFNDRVIISSPPITGNIATFTAECWVKWDRTFVEFDRIMTFHGPGTRIEIGVGLNYQDPFLSCFFLSTGGDILSMYPYMPSLPPIQFNDGNWHHVAFVRDGANFTLYADGQLERTVFEFFSFNITGMKFGQWSGNINVEAWEGNIDEARVWNIARTQAQIQADRYNYSLPTSTPGLVAYYKFDHGTGGGNNAGYTNLSNSVNPGSNSGTLLNFDLAGSTSNWLGSGTFLPIELHDFKAHYNKYTNNVALDWATASEHNSDHFELQHSTDAQNWRTLADYTARGQSATLSEYQHLHGNPANGKNYYRLKMVDTDGSFEYSKIVYATAADRDELFVAHPNPVRDLLYLDLGVQPEKPASVMIIDGLNRVVETLELTNQQNQINLAHLDAGIYTLVCNTGDWFVRQQIIKL
jgi:Concanavalin A-like lectin/glucanases superfamily/Secretion system C-terminal sorting domain